MPASARKSPTRPRRWSCSTSCSAMAPLPIRRRGLSERSAAPKRKRRPKDVRSFSSATSAGPIRIRRTGVPSGGRPKHPQGLRRVVERGSSRLVRGDHRRPEGSNSMKSIFQKDLKVVNVGLRGFADNAATAGGDVTHLSWAPPAGADAALGWKLACLVADQRIEEANRVAYGRYLAAQPRLIDLVLAQDATAGLAKGERRILHAGPPIAWADMCGPQQGAITGAILYEGWANSLEAAGTLAAPGRRALEPCHPHA